MGIIKVIDQVGRCYSNADGMILQHLIINHFHQGNSVTVDFSEISGVTSSFINTALIELLNQYDFSYIKSHLKFVNTNSQINMMIRKRFSSEVNRRKNLLATV